MRIVALATFFVTISKARNPGNSQDCNQSTALTSAVHFLEVRPWNTTQRCAVRNDSKKSSLLSLYALVLQRRCQPRVRLQIALQAQKAARWISGSVIGRSL